VLVGPAGVARLKGCRRVGASAMQEPLGPQWPRRGPAVLAALLVLVSCVSGTRQLAQAGSATAAWMIRRPRDLALGLADDYATELLVLSDIALQPADFDGLPSPVVVSRNVTVRCVELGQEQAAHTRVLRTATVRLQ
jgi:hypothetical protein